MAQMKTRPTGQAVEEFIASISDPRMRADCAQLVLLMEGATRSSAKMWGKIVGFGSRTLRYADGRETDWMVIAFAPRARSIALYLGPGEAYEALAPKLGKHTGGGTSCLHIRSLEDIHLPTLKKLIAASAKAMSRDPVRPARC